MVTASWFLNATEARNNIVKDIAVHGEICALESQVLLAAQRGDYEVVVNTSPWTLPASTTPEIFEVDPATSVITIPSHGFVTGDVVNVSSTGILPPPLIAGCPYYVIVIDPDHIMLAANKANAMAGLGLNIDISLGVISVSVANHGSGYLTVPTVTPLGGNPATAATLQAYLDPAGGLYSVSMITNGSGFTDVPSVSVTPLGSGGAAGLATFTVVGMTVAGGGSYYNLNDIIYVSGGSGVQATARVTGVNGGSVTQISLASGGNYTALPSTINCVTTTTGSGSGCLLNLSMGIKSISVAAPGVNYVNQPLVNINGGGGSGATASVTLSAGGLGSFVVTNPGSGYTGQPTIDIVSGANGTVTAQLAATTVSVINVTNAGSTFTYTPSVTLESVGSGAAPSVVSMKAVGLVMDNPGLGYVPGDQLQISGGIGNGSCVIEVVTTNTAGNILTYVMVTPGSYTTLPVLISNNVIGGTGVGAEFSLLMGIDQITLLTSGSGYTTPPAVVFSGGGGQGAAAHTVLQADTVDSIVVTSPGSGFVSVPAVSITSGSGATAQAYIVPTTVSTAPIVSGGSGYTLAPQVQFVGGGGSGAAGYTVLTGDAVSNIVITDGGTGYTDPPQVIIDGNATAVAVLHATTLDRIEVTNPGENYTANPVVNIAAGDGAAVSVLAPTSISSVYVTNAGNSYTTDPVLDWTPGANQVGTVTLPLTKVNRSFSVRQVGVTTPGQGYQTAPGLVFSAPSVGGTTATATATIGSGSGIFSLTQYGISRDYYLVWKGLTPSSDLIVRPYDDRMNAVIKYFTDLGYTINREVNPATGNTMQWHILW